MSLNHGINTYKSATRRTTVATAKVSIPFFVGAWPCHAGQGFTGKPQIAYSFDEAKALGGYSAEWRDGEGNPKWSLCQAMVSQFELFGMAPAIFYNVFDPAVHKKAVESASFPVADHIVRLSADVIDDEGLIVKDQEDTLVKGTDYEVIYSSGECIIELLPASTHIKASMLDIAYNEADLSGITASTIEAAIEKIEDCKALLGIAPTLICCPGWSQTPSVAAVMAVKAGSINGIFMGKAVVDLDTSTDGAASYKDVLKHKTENGYTDENMHVCWPLVVAGGDLFDYSVIYCGHIAALDHANDDCPYESPSNKALPIDGCVNKAGEEITLSVQQADVVSYGAGVVTALNFNGWTAWGNYTGCWPEETDVAKSYICTSRMMDFLGNRFVENFWRYVDRPLTRVRIDAIVNEFNSYLNALTHDGKLCGGEIQYVADNNPTDDLIAGKFRLDVTAASPVPAQQINLFCEYDVATLVASLTV